MGPQKHCRFGSAVLFVVAGGFKDAGKKIIKQECHQYWQNLQINIFTLRLLKGGRKKSLRG